MTLKLSYSIPCNVTMPLHITLFVVISIVLETQTTDEESDDAVNMENGLIDTKFTSSSSSVITYCISELGKVVMAQQVLL